MDGRTTSNRELARGIGVSETAVRRAEKAGRIGREADGSWDLAKVQAAWSSNTDPSQQRRSPTRAQHRGRPATMKPVPEAAVGAVEPVSAGNMTFMQARTANEVLKAQERRVRLQRMKGEPVDRGAISAEFATAVAATPTRPFDPVEVQERFDRAYEDHREAFRTALLAASGRLGRRLAAAIARRAHHQSGGGHLPDRGSQPQRLALPGRHPRRFRLARDRPDGPRSAAAALGRERTARAPRAPTLFYSRPNGADSGASASARRRPPSRRRSRRQCEEPALGRACRRWRNDLACAWHSGPSGYHRHGPTARR
jgi:hypothetical protein